jgi:hypothetical protein
MVATSASTPSARIGGAKEWCWAKSGMIGPLVQAESVTSLGGAPNWPIVAAMTALLGASANPTQEDTMARKIAPKPDVKAALIALVNHVERETCQHEDTHRGGVIWTICDGCGKKWADDRGGFVPYSDPPALAEAKRVLACT